MASKTSSQKCRTQVKKESVQEAENKIAQKLKLDLERDILRLFQDSVYCDVKFTVHSYSLLTHSCILKTRASRFYKFICAEFEVSEENGISVYNIYSASFTYLQTFVENIYTNVHSILAEDKIIKHLKETKNHTLGTGKTDKLPISSALTPDSDLFFTPKCSPSELQKPFGSSKLKITENNVASYYRIASVDDIPVEVEEKKFTEELLEKELAEQDELLTSFQTILSKKSKTKPNSLSLGASSQPTKKTKPKFNTKFDSNLLLFDCHEKKRYSVPHWKPNPVNDRTYQREKYLSVKTNKKNISSFKPQEKVDVGTYFEDPINSVCSSDMDVSTTAGDSGLEVSLICQQETKENTTSETSGVDLTEAAINEDIPNDETISTKQSSMSSVSSDAGTWDANDDFKMKSVAESMTLSGNPTHDGKNQLNEDEINRLDEMEKNIHDCEMFLFMERQAFLNEKCYRNSQDREDVPVRLNANENFNQYARKQEMSNPEECLQGETDHRRNYDEENYYNSSLCDGKNDAINPEEKNDANESFNEGAAEDRINSNFEYLVQPDILRDVQEAKTPPCTPKKLKKEGPEEIESAELQEEIKPRSWENNTQAVSNYFIDASSLLDENEIISPPISLINFKPLQSFEENEANNNTEVEEEPQTVSKKIVTNFYIPDSSEEVSYLQENERRQGDFIFKNSIPHFSKHEVGENQSVDSSERLRGGADNTPEDESEQVVPSADIEYSPPGSLNNKDEEKCSYSVQSNYFESLKPSIELESGDYVDGTEDYVEDSRANVAESVNDISSSSVCSESPNLRRRNESAPIISGGMDFVEEVKTVQKKPSQSQGEAWIVTFDDEKKPKNKYTRPEMTESGDEMTSRSRPLKRRDFDEDRKNFESTKPEQWAYPVQKSNSSGYFLDFSNSSDGEVSQPSEVKTEKKNMFSMFIGIDDDTPKSNSLKKSRPTLEREGTFNKSTEEAPKEGEKNESRDERKKPFYMFIESDSPLVKRKQLPKRQSKVPEPVENSAKKNVLRTQSYTIDQDSGVVSQPEVKTDFEYSSSDNSLPYSELNYKINRPSRGTSALNKSHSTESKREAKITAWAETKQPSEGNALSSESWLRSKDIQINYRGRSNERAKDIYANKEASHSMNADYKDKYYDKHKYKETKPPERDSGVVLCDKGDDSFVKLSDLDSSGSSYTKQAIDRMSKSNSEDVNGRMFSNEETSLSKSIGSEGPRGSARGSAPYNKEFNQSLSRLFPNLNAQSIARIGRKDGDRSEVDIQASETSEVSSSMQSSVEPSGLEISTSETDVSSHVGTSSKLGEDLLKMFLEEISPDLVVEVNGRRIKAHKCILSSRCQYFAAMLSGGWVESAGNVISLQGFSYNAVHFALRHIYSGESRIPESLSIVELATLADMLCLDGLQEIISYNLKVKYCHSFHVPCTICSVGVLDCLPITAAYGLDDLYRKCLRWITKYFVKIWPTKSFGSLPKELLEKCYQHYVVHMTVDNVLDTLVNIDKVRGSLPNVRWAEGVSRLVNKLHDATLRYIAEHFSSVLTSDNFLALGKDAGWNVSRLEDSLIETIRFLPPEQACWSHARLHRILSVATGPDPPPEMNWNENFLKLLQLIGELVENSLIKQAPRAAKSKAWRQMEPELRSRIQEAACLVLPPQEQTSGYRRSSHIKKENGLPNITPTAKSRNLELRQIKLAMTQQTTNKIPTTSRPLSLQMDQRPKKDSRFIPLRQSVSTSSVRKIEPRVEGIRKSQSRSQIIGNVLPEPKKTINPKYSEVKSRYLEPKSPLKNVSDKPAPDVNQRRRYISSSDSSRNCSPALRSSNSRSSIPQAKKPEISRESKNSKTGSTTALYGRRDKSLVSNKTESPAVKTYNRLTKDENMSTDSLCTESLASEKEATIQRRPGKENSYDKKRLGNSKSSNNSPVSRRHSSENWSSTASKTPVARKLIMPNENKSGRRVSNQTVTSSIPCRSNVSSPRTTTTTTKKNQRGRLDSNLVNGNVNPVDSENNKKNLKDASQPKAVERSGTFLKDEPTVLKKPQLETEA